MSKSKFYAAFRSSENERRCGMNNFFEWCIIVSASAGFVNYAFLLIIEGKLNEIKREISRLKNQKGGE